MALDEALLESAVNQKRWTLRFYQWSRPTLSLGYFQPHTARNVHAASREADLVRRSTGGGAILHDAELTYSITLPAAETERGHSDLLYYALHETLIDALAEFGVRAGLQPRNRIEPNPDSFLCFHRRTRGDVLLAAAAGAHPWKIAGSAQRRSKGALLQHGSVLLQASPAAPELLGIGELTGQALAAASLLPAWQLRIRDRLHLRLEADGPTSTEVARARQIESETFAHPAWTERR